LAPPRVVSPADTRLACWFKPTTAHAKSSLSRGYRSAKRLPIYSAVEAVPHQRALAKARSSSSSRPMRHSCRINSSDSHDVSRWALRGSAARPRTGPATSSSRSQRPILVPPKTPAIP
jgi:hypothetical protein